MSLDREEDLNTITGIFKGLEVGNDIIEMLVCLKREDGELIKYSVTMFDIPTFFSSKDVRVGDKLTLGFDVSDGLVHLVRHKRNE